MKMNRLINLSNVTMIDFLNRDGKVMLKVHFVGDSYVYINTNIPEEKEEVLKLRIAEIMKNGHVIDVDRIKEDEI